ncbi:hypothetical protein IMG5_119700 [Ichthyophthirius multifiliis]|uniref:Uncharacterized protein n=1 Tax=Ichthyophthirius multifiliis TaxID=5932 RepID=G0QUV2_ICHMU|nr:hypothetical protein IMG5_119700 [Ichthyophthirius multifiliis]EGR31002.1 hypothetical protein IMG5_119700 [Ichthyophthirius multifiliis]|eukprot:XP_004034488.1 hypothetical protein IMG5_119700 [Ichthyophthirius multifiliis]
MFRFRKRSFSENFRRLSRYNCIQKYDQVVYGLSRRILGIYEGIKRIFDQFFRIRNVLKWGSCFQKRGCFIIKRTCSNLRRRAFRIRQSKFYQKRNCIKQNI